MSESNVGRRALALYAESEQAVFRRTDRMFAALMTLQWLAGVGIALWISPRTWSGAYSQTHIHVWAALFLGGTITALPVFLALAYPGGGPTRHVIAVGQALTSALLIHLTGGRIETHFHVFGSLAFLAFYRDWRVLITASAVVAVDHFLRGMYWPQSVYGLLAVEPWRWLEQAGWVVFEDAFLIFSIVQSRREMMAIAERQANLEGVNEAVERKVLERTTELRESERALQGAVQKAQESEHFKTEFLANMSHEIRTPMTAILGFTDLLADPDLAADERAGYLDTIQSNGQHLLAVINDILDLSKISAGKMIIERIACSPARLIADVTSLMRARALDKGLTFDVEYRDAIPEAVQTDPTRLRQILLNLLGNAIKFTEAGGVRLAVGMVPDDGAEPGRFFFEVHDSGIGITPAAREGLFQPFTQADASMTRRFGGTGLGLMISRRLVEMLGGSIRVQSEPGRGSTFTVTIDPGPLDGVRMLGQVAARAATVVAPVMATASALRLSGRILLAEDGPDNQRLISFHLRKAGAEVVVAENGRIACDLVRDAEARGEPFSVVLMDMQMPVLDGYQATAELRSTGYRRPIIALTAHAMESDRAKCLAAGCDDFLSKPVSRDGLLQTVLRFGDGADSRPAAGAGMRHSG